MSRLKYNGYIVQRKKKTDYYGIDGDNWYLNYDSNDLFFREFYDENIDKAWNDLDYVDCCTDKLYINRYIDESKRMGIDFRILLCATCRKFPILDKLEFTQKKVVLGYDYAYSGGSYYSCILNDIISGRIQEFREITLNENGLFNTYEEVGQFEKMRNKMMASDIEYIFERGDFIIYEITEVTI